MIYFDNASTTHPKAPGVSDAVRELLENGSFNINRGSGAYATESLVFDTRAKLAALFDASSPRNVVFTSGVTASINYALKGLLKAGGHVLTTSMEHNAVARPLAQLKKTGVTFGIVECERDGSLDICAFRQKLIECAGYTKLVVMTHASNVCGSILPLREAGALCREHGIPMLVDTAQTAGSLPISMREDNIDILAFTAHKGLLAMQGLGGLILSNEIAAMLPPLIAGGTGSYSDSEDMPDVLPDRLEAGTQNIPGIAALNKSIGYINETGLTAIHSRETELINRLADGLSTIRSIKIHGSRKDKCAILAVEFYEKDPAEIAAKLEREHGIVTRAGLHCAPWAHKTLGTFPHGLLRFSLGVFNTVDEVDEVVNVIMQICG